MKVVENERFTITKDYDCINTKEVFKKLLKVLMAFAYNLLGNSTLRLQVNRTELAYDLSMEAINKYLENKDKFDPTKNPDLVNHLKFYYLRQLVFNFKELKGQSNEIIQPVDSQQEDQTEGQGSNGELVIQQQIDLKNLVDNIRSELQDDSVLSELFELKIVKDYKRKEIVKELGITVPEYTNRIRRLGTVLKKVRNQYS